MKDKRTKNLVVNGEVLELGYFSLKFQQWLTRLWKLPSVYTSYVSQTGTAAPVVSVLDNTIGALTWTRTGVGVYTVTSDALFTEGKTTPNKDAYTDIDGNYITAEFTNTSTITIKTYDAADVTTLSDNVLNNQLVNIEVYNN